MSVEVIGAIFAGIVAVIGAIGTVIKLFKNVERIHVLVNSQSTLQREKISELSDRIAGLTGSVKNGVVAQKAAEDAAHPREIPG